MSESQLPDNDHPDRIIICSATGDWIEWEKPGLPEKMDCPHGGCHCTPTLYDQRRVIVADVERLKDALGLLRGHVKDDEGWKLITHALWLGPRDANGEPVFPEKEEDDEDRLFLDQRPFIGACSVCGEARQDDYTCRDGGSTIRDVAGAAQAAPAEHELLPHREEYRRPPHA